MNEYKCSNCNETHKKTSSDEELWKEYYREMPEAMTDEVVLICHECWIEFMQWYKTLTYEDKRKIREDYVKRNYQ